MTPNHDPARENPFQPPDGDETEPAPSKHQQHFSVEHEPALGGGGFAGDPSELRAAPVDRPPDEIETLRDSIAAEPALAQHADPQAWLRWLEAKRRGCTPAGNLAVTLLAAVLSGPFAIIGAFMAGVPGTGGLLYAIVFGPVAEELLKQSGMTYLLEKKPYRVFAAWQFVLVAVIAGLVFATIENLVYINIYFPASGVGNVAAAAAFRWVACTLLHVSCAAIASLGLVRVWRRQLHEGGSAELTAAFPFFVAAMVVHGTYNFAAMFVQF